MVIGSTLAAPMNANVFGPRSALLSHPNTALVLGTELIVPGARQLAAHSAAPAVSSVRLFSSGSTLAIASINPAAPDVSVAPLRLAVISEVVPSIDDVLESLYLV